MIINKPKLECITLKSTKLSKQDNLLFFLIIKLYKNDRKEAKISL